MPRYVAEPHVSFLSFTRGKEGIKTKNSRNFIRSSARNLSSMCEDIVRRSNSALMTTPTAPITSWRLVRQRDDESCSQEARRRLLSARPRYVPLEQRGELGPSPCRFSAIESVALPLCRSGTVVFSEYLPRALIESAALVSLYYG